MYVKVLKPFFDFSLAFIILVGVSPVLLILTAALLISNKGKALFFQQRIGLNNKPFTIIKYRTMCDFRDGDGALLPDGRRLTPIGKLVRSWSLDELPQLINVLKGEMSLIGPRPLLPSYLPLYNKAQAVRHNVKPGITGWAQINGRNALSWEEKFSLDTFYAQNLSLSLDVAILFITFKKVILRNDINTSNAMTMDFFQGTPIHPESAKQL